MLDRLRNRSLPARILVYATISLLGFALAAGVGAIGALMLRGDLALPGSGKVAGPTQAQGDATQARTDAGGASQDGATSQEGSAAQQSEAEYRTKVGDMQKRSVDTFMDCHAKLRRYDALSSQDIEELRADQVALQAIVEQAEDVDPPQGYAEQYEAFRLAISHLQEAAQLGYGLAADPVAATQTKFVEYDRHVEEADARLQESNEMLGRDYGSLEGVREAGLS